MQELLKEHPEVLSQMKHFKDVSFSMTSLFTYITQENFRTLVIIPLHEEAEYELLSMVPVPEIVEGAVRIPDILDQVLEVNRQSSRYITYTL